MIFKKQAEEDFNIQAAEFPEMECQPPCEAVS